MQIPVSILTTSLFQFPMTRFFQLSKNASVMKLKIFSTPTTQPGVHTHSPHLLPIHPRQTLTGKPHQPDTMAYCLSAIMLCQPGQASRQFLSAAAAVMTTANCVTAVLTIHAGDAETSPFLQEKL